MKKTMHLLALLLLITGLSSCTAGNKKEAISQEETSSMVRKYNDDGTLSSINPVDEEGFLDGVKINYYEDGKTIHSKITYEHGRKHGPALWYYKNGQVHEHTAYYFGRKQGLTKKYYPTGELMEELTYEQGEVQPGARKFDRQGKEIN
jgi:antitoxin component YwqK of YwqJK toxin-antitoxin module